MKKTEILTVNGTKVQYYAVEPGESPREVRSQIPQGGYIDGFFFSDEPEYVIEKSELYFGGIELKAVYEYQPETDSFFN